MRIRDRSCARRRGFALMTVMAVVAGSVTIGLLVAREAQAVISAASNRKAYTMARWWALDCLERARAALDDVAATDASAPSAWSRLDALLQQAAIVTPAHVCSLSAVALGDQLDANSASPDALRRLFAVLELSPGAADSLVDALLDWRDEDAVSRTFGAERDWYVANGRVAPRNAPLRSPRELALIRGFENRLDLIRHFGTQQHRSSLAHTPRAVLLSLPGFTTELVDDIIRRRSEGDLPSEVFHLASALSENARDSLMSQQANLAGRIAMEPDGWILISRASVPGSSVTCVLELTMTRLGSGTQIIQRREWWQ